MRPTARPQSAIRFPLNHVLGTEANVRVLRDIMLSDIPVGAAELARRTSLQLSGVARVCARLEDLGVIEAVGRGTHNRQYRKAARFGLGTALIALFVDERDRGERILRELQERIRGGSHVVRAAWLEGPIARGTDRPEDPIVVSVLAEPAQVDDARLSVWQGLLGLQKMYDVVVELKLVTMADLKTLDKHARAELEDARPLLGPAPLDLIAAASARPGARAKPKHHGDLDARSKAVAEEIAERIRRDPSLVEEAVRYLERRLSTATGGERLELEEWQNLLTTMSAARLRRFLVQDDARARRLRQSSPFLAVLSREARESVRSAVERRK